MLINGKEYEDVVVVVVQGELGNPVQYTVTGLIKDWFKGGWIFDPAAKTQHVYGKVYGHPSGKYFEGEQIHTSAVQYMDPGEKFVITKNSCYLLEDKLPDTEKGELVAKKVTRHPTVFMGWYLGTHDNWDQIDEAVQWNQFEPAPELVDYIGPCDCFEIQIFGGLFRCFNVDGDVSLEIDSSDIFAKARKATDTEIQH